jgi:hypothetical protein
VSASRPILAALVAVALPWLPVSAHAAGEPASRNAARGEPLHQYHALHPGLPPAAPFPTTPAGAIEALARAYEDMSLPTLRDLLADDFHFHTTDEKVARLIDVNRARELQVAGALFRGLVQGGKVVEPAADSISFRVEGLSENADPEHPDSTAHYRTVVAARFEGDLYVPGDKVFQTGTQGAQIFYVVRGDAAVLAGGSPADSTRWYIRRWFEDIEGLVASLGEIEGDCSQADSASVQAAALAFGIHPLGNPACPALDIACDLPRSGPARIEVFDVMGRRMTGQTFEVAAPGTVRLQAGAGTHLAPGAYWVRLTQGDQGRTRMVVVAR